MGDLVYNFHTTRSRYRNYTTHGIKNHIQSHTLYYLYNYIDAAEKYTTGGYCPLSHLSLFSSLMLSYQLMYGATVFWFAGDL